jgi:dTDP-4-dehydrorhamnose 3,5-epimerase
MAHEEGTSLSGIERIGLPIFNDERGYFKEAYAIERCREAGIRDTFVQDSVSLSKANVLRGLHGDLRLSKLVQVLSGNVYDVAVDIRPASATYLRWQGMRLSAREPVALYIPAGFLHGFLALTDDVLFFYKQSAEYDPASEIGVAWDDPDLAIPWPLRGAPILSRRDRGSPTLRQLGYV